MLAIANSEAYCPPEILVRWLSGRKQRFAKAPYLKRVPRVRIPPSPRPCWREREIHKRAPLSDALAGCVIPPSPPLTSVRHTLDVMWLCSLKYGDSNDVRLP